jgi:hypothetical protein
MTPKIDFKSSSGQASIEAVVSAFGLMLMTALLLAFFYFCILITCLQYSSHELLVCREIKDPYSCETQFKKQLKTYLRFGKVDSFWTSQTPTAQQLTVILSFKILSFAPVHWKYKDQVNLPLQ